MYSEYLLIGEVIKPQGISGMVKVKPYTDDPDRFYKLDKVFVLKDKNYISCPIQNISVRKDGFVYCMLDHSQSCNSAEKQRGWKIYIDREHAVHLQEGQYFISDLIGCRVTDRTGILLGTIKDVLQPGANDVYEISQSNGKTLYLPVLPFVIVSVDVRESTIIVDEMRLPEVAVFED